VTRVKKMCEWWINAVTHENKMEQNLVKSNTQMAKCLQQLNTRRGACKMCREMPGFVSTVERLRTLPYRRKTNLLLLHGLGH